MHLLHGVGCYWNYFVHSEFIYGLELYLELFCHMIHCLLVDICSDDMVHYYTWLSNILQNLNKFVNYNINIWFLFFELRSRYLHSFHGVSMRDVFDQGDTRTTTAVCLGVTDHDHACLLLLRNTIC